MYLDGVVMILTQFSNVKIAEGDEGKELLVLEGQEGDALFDRGLEEKFHRVEAETNESVVARGENRIEEKELQNDVQQIENFHHEIKNDEKIIVRTNSKGNVGQDQRCRTGGILRCI